MTQRKNGECAKETNTKAEPTEIHQTKPKKTTCQTTYMLFSMIL